MRKFGAEKHEDHNREEGTTDMLGSPGRPNLFLKEERKGWHTAKLPTEIEAILEG